MLSDEAHKHYLRLREIRKRMQDKPKPKLVIKVIEQKEHEHKKGT